MSDRNKRRNIRPTNWISELRTTLGPHNSKWKMTLASQLRLYKNKFVASLQILFFLVVTLCFSPPEWKVSWQFGWYTREFLTSYCAILMWIIWISLPNSSMWRKLKGDTRLLMERIVNRNWSSYHKNNANIALLKWAFLEIGRYRHSSCFGKFVGQMANFNISRITSRILWSHHFYLFIYLLVLKINF